MSRQSVDEHAGERCYGKSPLSTIRVAKRALRQLRQLGEKGRIYKCPWGKHWHVTSKPGRGQREEDE